MNNIFESVDDFDQLAELYQNRIEPIIRRQIASKMRTTLNRNDDSHRNEEAFELLSESKVLILGRLRRDFETGGETIRDVESYVRTVASNVFNQYLRRKYPRRSSLRNQLRYLLTHQPRLAMWKGDADEWLCGFSEHRENCIAGPIDLDDIEIERMHTKVGGSGARRLIAFTLAVFEIVDHAATFDDFVAFACDFLGIEESVEMPEPANLAELKISESQNALGCLEDTEFVRLVWQEIKGLPLNHRVSLLMNYKDDAGEDLLAMLPIMRVATVRQIAEALGFDAEEFGQIWNELPWEDNRIAEHLGVTRQQVINLRQSARQMLRRKLKTTS